MLKGALSPEEIKARYGEEILSCQQQPGADMEEKLGRWIAEQNAAIAMLAEVDQGTAVDDEACSRSIPDFHVACHGS